MPKAPTKTERAKAAADKIMLHLQRFENDPVINAPDPKYKTRSYYYAFAAVRGPRVVVSYISYQGSSKLTAEEAERYLAWLDAGNVGRHFEAFRALAAAEQKAREKARVRAASDDLALDDETPPDFEALRNKLP